jgi:N-terminal domain of anti-restriction factor ArdC
LLAWTQCAERGITPGPIATFMGWKDKGRYVRKGEKAIVLCMPVTIKRKPTDDKQVDAESEEGKPETFTRFAYRPHWFVLAQTEGQAVEPVPIPEMGSGIGARCPERRRRAVTLTDGNCQGYPRQRTIAVSPLAELQALGIAFVSLGEGIDATTPAGKAPDAHSRGNRGIRTCIEVPGGSIREAARVFPHGCPHRPSIETRLRSIGMISEPASPRSAARPRREDHRHRTQRFGQVCEHGFELVGFEEAAAHVVFTQQRE